MDRLTLAKEWSFVDGNCVRVGGSGQILEKWSYSPSQPIPPCSTWSTGQIIGYAVLGVVVAGVLALSTLKT